MKVYKDLITDDEMGPCDSRVVETVEGMLLEIEGEYMKPPEEANAYMFSNVPAEGEEADAGEAAAGGEDDNEGKDPNINQWGEDRRLLLDLAKNFRYNVGTRPSKAIYTADTKAYCKTILLKLKELGKSQEELDAFSRGTQAATDHITANWDNWTCFYVSENADKFDTPMYIPCGLRADGKTPYIILWKHGLWIYEY